MAKTLVTGGAGFVGSHLVEHLVSSGKDVVVLDDLSAGSLDNLSGVQNVEVVTGSVLDETRLDSLVARTDLVFHLAAAVGVKTILADPFRMFDCNVGGTRAVLRACAKHDRPMFLASSSEVYGKSSQLPFREDGDLVLGPTDRPRWSYGCSKAIAEFLVYAHRRVTGLPVAVARLFNTAGPRQTGRYGMVIPRFVQQAVAGEPISVYGDGKQTRCFCHVNDVVCAIAQLVVTPEAHNQTVNLGGEDSVTIRELAERVKSLTGSRSTVAHIQFEEAYEAGIDDMLHRQPDLSRAKALLEFAPKLSLDRIVSDVIEYQTAR